MGGEGAGGTCASPSTVACFLHSNRKGIRAGEEVRRRPRPRGVRTMCQAALTGPAEAWKRHHEGGIAWASGHRGRDSRSHAQLCLAWK